MRWYNIGEDEAKKSFRNRIQSIFYEKENVGKLDDAGSSNSEKKQYGVGNCAANLAEWFIVQSTSSYNVSKKFIIFLILLYILRQIAR